MALVSMQAKVRAVVSSFLKFSKEDDIDPEQLKIGIKVEREHRDVYDMLKKEFGDKLPFSEEELYTLIAKAHIKEDREYYTKLLKHVEKH